MKRLLLVGFFFEIGFVLALLLPPAAVVMSVAVIALSRPPRGVGAPVHAVGER